MFMQLIVGFVMCASYVCSQEAADGIKGDKIVAGTFSVPPGGGLKGVLVETVQSPSPTDSSSTDLLDANNELAERVAAHQLSGGKFNLGSPSKENPFALRVGDLATTIERLPPGDGLNALLDALKCESAQAFAALTAEDKQKKVRDAMESMHLPSGENSVRSLIEACCPSAMKQPNCQIIWDGGVPGLGGITCIHSVGSSESTNN